VALKLDGYVRVSRVGGRAGEGYISPKVQREAIEGYARELDGEIIAWHDDQDFTGGSADRPGFQAALERLRAGASEGLVVMKIDRFARSVADGAAVVREIIDREQIFASVHERIDPKTPEGNYMLNGFLNNAELFLNQAKAGWWIAKSRAVARGAHIGPTPIGYQRIPKGEPRSGCLVPDPTYGPVITELFERGAGDDTGAELATWMTTAAPRESGQPWQSSEIRRWLANRVYLGEVHYGDLVNTEAHDALTAPDTFERAQRKPGAPRRANGRRFLLSGLVRCSCCRYSMGGFNYGGADHATPVYRCGRARTRGCSEASVIVAKRLEDHVVGLVREHLHGLQLEAADAGVDLATLDREASEAEAELEGFAADLNARRLLGEDGWQRALEARAGDRDAKRAARDRAYSNSRLVAVAQDVDDLDHEALGDLLRGMVRHVFVRRRPRGADVADRVLVIWSDDPRAIDVPGPHRSAQFDPVRW
jgi:DNA invertase Pin-like site-specific DNA recombinase